MLNTLVILVLFMFLSCAKKPSEKVLEAIDLAQTHLSQNECERAIELLEEVGRQPEDPIYLQVLASAYACRAGFSELSFISTDIPRISADPLTLLQSLSILSESYEAEADSGVYEDLQEAINVLLTSNEASGPSQSARNTTFGPRRAGDIGIQLLFLTISQMGKFLNFYGNVDLDGEKGLGAASTDEQGATASTCFLTYTDPRAVSFIQSAPVPGGICNNLASDQGHPDLTLTGPETNRRLCEGLMLLTNMIDTLKNIDLPENSALSFISEVADDIEAFKTTAILADPALSTLLNTTSQRSCEALLETTAEKNNMQYIYALVFEAGLK